MAQERPLLLTHDPAPLPAWASRSWLVYQGKDAEGRDVYDRCFIPCRPVEWIGITIEIVPPGLFADPGH